MNATNNAPATAATPATLTCSRISYRAERWAPLAARLIDAATGEEALDKIGPVWSIHRISIARGGR